MKNVSPLLKDTITQLHRDIDVYCEYGLVNNIYDAIIRIARIEIALSVEITLIKLWK